MCKELCAKVGGTGVSPSMPKLEIDHFGDDGPNLKHIEVAIVCLRFIHMTHVQTSVWHVQHSFLLQNTYVIIIIKRYYKHMYITKTSSLITKMSQPKPTTRKQTLFLRTGCPVLVKDRLPWQNSPWYHGCSTGKQVHPIHWYLRR